jgi:hypothetical protein
MINTDSHSLTACVIVRHSRSTCSTSGGVKVEIVYDSLYLYFWCSEVDKQTYLLPGCLQVVEALRFVDVFDGLYGLQFDKYLSLYQQVGQVFPDNDVIVMNRYRSLLLNFQSLLL